MNIREMMANAAKKKLSADIRAVLREAKEEASPVQEKILVPIRSDQAGMKGDKGFSRMVKERRMVTGVVAKYIGGKVKTTSGDVFEVIKKPGHFEGQAYQYVAVA